MRKSQGVFFLFLSALFHCLNAIPPVIISGVVRIMEKVVFLSTHVHRRDFSSMKTENYLKRIVQAQHEGKPEGMYSVCSYSRHVIEAALLQSMEDGCPVLIESTCNQVNQFGGYTGMKPADFRESILSIARSMGFSPEGVIYGGDHLGPYPFCDEPAAGAMEKAREMVRQYIQAGAIKIHLDTSMRCADDPGTKNTPLDGEVIAERCAQLCRVAEDTHVDMYNRRSGTPELLYVIGTEVPAPGGSDEVEEGLKITKVEDFEETIALTKKYFYRNNLQGAWERVIAVVVQPGVEHGDHTIIEYDRRKAEALTNSLKKHRGIVFEGHATDYQTREGLRAMVEDGIAFLKVGPSLTFSAREALFLLNYIEDELFSCNEMKKRSHFIRTLEQAMLKNPVHWKKHYTGSEWELSFARKYSLFDRSRYYLGDEDVIASMRTLIENLRSVNLPLPLMSQFFPVQYAKIRRKKLDKDPESLIRDRIREVLADYSFAVGKV